MQRLPIDNSNAGASRIHGRISVTRAEKLSQNTGFSHAGGMTVS
jgi:hypothetical protein